VCTEANTPGDKGMTRHSLPEREKKNYITKNITSHATLLANEMF